MQPYFLLLFFGFITLSHGQDFRTPVGNPCAEGSGDCVKNAECVSSVCLCKSGYSVDPSLGCKVDYGGNCSSDSDCNTPVGLICVDSLCKCSSPSEEEYLSDIGSCVNSTMKLMLDDVVALINQTEVELQKFSTLLQIFMIHAATSGGDGNNTDATALSEIKIDPVVYQQLEALEEQLKSGQTPVADIAPVEYNGLQESTPEAKSQTVPTPETRQIPGPGSQPSGISGSPTGQGVPGQPFVSSPPLPTQSIQPQPTLGTIPQNTLPNLPNSINSLIFPIVPSQSPGNLNNLGNPSTGIFRQGQTNLPPLGINPGSFNNLNNPNFNNNLNQQVDNLANVLPSFLSMFRQFLPMLQSFNNVLGSNLFRQNQQGLAPGAGNLNNLNSPNENRGLFGLPKPRILQIPGRLFNGLFGRNSTIQMLKRRIIPIDFTNKAIPFLPWPLG